MSSVFLLRLGLLPQLSLPSLGEVHEKILNRKDLQQGPDQLQPYRRVPRKQRCRQERSNQNPAYKINHVETAANGCEQRGPRRRSGFLFVGHVMLLNQQVAHVQERVRGLHQARRERRRESKRLVHRHCDHRVTTDQMMTHKQPRKVGTAEDPHHIHCEVRTGAEARDLRPERRRRLKVSPMRVQRDAIQHAEEAQRDGEERVNHGHHAAGVLIPFRFREQAIAGETQNAPKHEKGTVQLPAAFHVHWGKVVVGIHVGAHGRGQDGNRKLPCGLKNVEHRGKGTRFR